MRKKPTGIPQIEDLLITESTHISKLNEIVLDAIEEEKLLSKKLAEFEDKNSGYGGMLADKVAQFAGSWKFIISFVMIMTTWVAVNTLLFSNAFDPFPFILLNLILSTIAAIQAPIIIMSQNRKEEKDRQRAINDYMVNLKSEIEIRNLHQKLDLLIAKQMSTLFELQNVQVEMMKEIKLLLGNNKVGKPPSGRNDQA
jgi:uncharacterized membrane protein